MVHPFDQITPTPLTAIWALIEDGPGAPKSPQWRAIAVHWTKINYPDEKLNVPAGKHPIPDFMGDVVDPRSATKAIIDNAVVEGRLLETSFQVAPFLQSSKSTGDKLTFMIDADAKQGDRPKYKDGQKAFLCGFASHTPPSGKGNEAIMPIYRDDFCPWGHIELSNGKRYKIEPMYFIPHTAGVELLINPSTKYKFTPPPVVIAPGAKFTSRMAAAPVPDLQPSSIVMSDDSADQATAQPPETEPEHVVGGANIKFASAEEEVDTATEPSYEEVQLLTRPLEETDFGHEAVEADREATQKGDDW